MKSLIDRLASIVPGASRRTLKQLLDHGRVFVDGKPARRADLDLKEGAKVTILPKAATAPGPKATIRVVFEDDHLIVVDKPPGLLTAAPRGEGRESAWSRLRRMLAGRRPRESAFLVHRLDEYASGLLVFAKTEKDQRLLKDLFGKHRIDRHYAAIVKSAIKREAGEFRSRLVEIPGKMHRVRALRPGDPEEMRAAARESVTRWRVRRIGEGWTALEVRLETGRKHQIRVHLAEAGHPVLGDRLYGGPRGSRLLLHAWVLGFTHPVTNKPVRFVSPPGPTFEEIAPGAFEEPSVFGESGPERPGLSAENRTVAQADRFSGRPSARPRAARGRGSPGSRRPPR